MRQVRINRMDPRTAFLSDKVPGEVTVETPDGVTNPGDEPFSHVDGNQAFKPMGAIAGWGKTLTVK